MRTLLAILAVLVLVVGACVQPAPVPEEPVVREPTEEPITVPEEVAEPAPADELADVGDVDALGEDLDVSDLDGLESDLSDLETLEI